MSLPMLHLFLGASLLLAASAAQPNSPQKIASASIPSLQASQPKTAISTPDTASLTTSAPASEPVGSKTRPLASTESMAEKPVDWFARTLGIIGVLLGFGNICFSFWKIGRDRRLSVEDDFWFRKIVAPVTIEPLLKTVMTLLQEMPNAGSEQEKLAEYARKITTEFQKLDPAMQTLALIDQAWPALIKAKLRLCEDVLTEHIGGMSIGEEQQSSNMIDLQGRVLKELNSALHEIKVGHLKK